MSHNTRRGGGAGFNKNITAASVGQRRPNANNYGQQQSPPQNAGPNQMNQGYNTHQQRQIQNQRQMVQQPQQQNIQQQMAKQQQMLAQKKQQLTQQQRQLQQKQQVVNQQKQTLQQQKDAELQKQKELELQRQKELELQKQKEMELQKQKEMELQKQREIEETRQKEIELQKQRELELKRDVELKKEELPQEAVSTEPIPQNGNTEMLDQPMEEGVVPPVPPFITNDGNVNVGERKRPMRRWKPRRKLSKYEIQRRRNMKLSKLLQPKSAMVILNEIVTDLSYNIEPCSENKFKATVVVDGIVHEGIGTAKATAKNNVAEATLRYMVKNKKLFNPQPLPPIISESKEDGTVGEEKVEPVMEVPEGEVMEVPEGEVMEVPKGEVMDTSEQNDQVQNNELQNEQPAECMMAWQQFASFAVYKLLTLWGEDPEVVKDEEKLPKKPSKKMPADAHLMNPLMLLNQMLPHLNFEELPRISKGRSYLFKVKCHVDGLTFIGTGSSKKSARRNAAFEVCRNVLEVNYPPEIFKPSAQTSN